MDGLNFLNQHLCMPSWLSAFPFGTFLSITLSNSWRMSISGLSSSPCNSFFLLFIYSAFLLYSFCSLIFPPKSFCFSCIQLLVYSHVSPPPTCWQNLFSSFSNVLFCLYRLILSWYVFKSSFFRQYLLIYIFRCIFRLVCCFVWAFSSQNIPACFLFLNTFACCQFP